MDVVFLYIFIISFIATLVRSTFGFGESLVAVPLLSIFIPIGVAVPLSVLISVLVALVVVIQDHSKIQLNSAKWLILFAIPGIPIGLLILIYGNEWWVKMGLGTLIILYSLYAMFGKNTFRLHNDNKLWLFICGFLSGVLGGAYGLNGPPLVIYGNMRKWSPKDFRATLQGYFLPASLIGVTGYIFKGLITAEVLKYFMVSLPAVFPAIFLGRYLNHKLNNASFFRYVYGGLLLIGAFLIVFCLLNIKT
ncbi:sulfite exporter TauE/SafE family protein [Mucilaginibacter sp. cycad4]|uniref:sulfite exporter TauE/SafE family protein n=1 Tax=Mucilaginibacter sp. cycad4 TaxID=3342096 RepID=UPI002AAB5D79|nr:sulfite exporter TauE/SafE family protein [Mucilaginibacter gossypii]WPU97763.1 sulfite exporter TauE/SafE family protein [Mucilaginibacter gossypii]